MWRLEVPGKRWRYGNAEREDLHAYALKGASGRCSLVYPPAYRLVDVGTSRHVQLSRSKRGWVVVRWWASSHGPGAIGPGDAGGGGDVQGAVGLHAEKPALGEGLQPVVGAAQAAQVRAGRDAAGGVRENVVVVGPAGPLAAVGHPAGPVSGADELPLDPGGGVAVGGRRVRPCPAPACPGPRR